MNGLPYLRFSKNLWQGPSQEAVQEVVVMSGTWSSVIDLKGAGTEKKEEE